MYLEHAEIGESEKSLEIVDYFVRNYIRGTNFEKNLLFGMMEAIQTCYKRGYADALELHTQKETYERIVRWHIHDERLEQKYMSEVPKFIELSNEYIRILEGTTTKEGRKKHLRVVK